MIDGKPRLSPFLLWLSASAALAGPPSPNDYAQGIDVTAAAGRPLVEIALPDVVYRSVTRADLGDLCVFNADGMPIPYALCASPETSTGNVAQQALPVFELREAQSRRSEGSRIEVQTAGGTQLNVQEQSSEAAGATNAGTHIIDVRGIEGSVREIQFDWNSPDGASAVRVRIEASRDLDRWNVLVPAATLLFVARGGQELKRERIELPSRQYDYLRVQRVDGGPPLSINAVTAQYVWAAAEVEPSWFTANPSASAAPDGILFDAERLAPVRYARVRLPHENSSVRIRLQSRADEKSNWRERWSGEVYQIVAGTQHRESPPARFEPTADRYWRVQILDDAQLYRDSTLQLGYRPARLRFLAQGARPYTLAFGSRRAEPEAASACDALLADVGRTERARLVSDGRLGDARVLGGDQAFKPLPKRTPTRLIVLWSVLIGGVALLVAMALSLLKRLRD